MRGLSINQSESDMDIPFFVGNITENVVGNKPAVSEVRDRAQLNNYMLSKSCSSSSINHSGLSINSLSQDIVSELEKHSESEAETGGRIMFNGQQHKMFESNISKDSESESTTSGRVDSELESRSMSLNSIAFNSELEFGKQPFKNSSSQPSNITTNQFNYLNNLKTHSSNSSSCRNKIGNNDDMSSNIRLTFLELPAKVSLPHIYTHVSSRSRRLYSENSF